jgi:hypothetical protein
MGKKHWLCSLQMGISWENYERVLARKVRQSYQQTVDSTFNLRFLLSQIKPEIRGDLVVSTSAGVKLERQWTDFSRQSFFNEGMHVLRLATLDGFGIALIVFEHTAKPSFYS